VVVKPVDGEEGKDVFIGPKDSMTGLEPTFPVLVQEFLDSSIGIPGIVEGMHDFRVALFNGEVIYSYYRTPPQGSFLANVSRGGKFEVVPSEKIPQIILDIAKEIDTRFIKYTQRFYGIDFAFTPEGPKIIEMNSKLGLLPNSDHSVFVRLKEKIALALHTMSQAD
jgi:glutathione synthase/RimK-type ligase-like ATP-grasp enzyme